MVERVEQGGVELRVDELALVAQGVLAALADRALLTDRCASLRLTNPDTLRLLNHVLFLLLFLICILTGAFLVIVPWPLA